MTTTIFLLLHSKISIKTGLWFSFRVKKPQDRILQDGHLFIYQKALNKMNSNPLCHNIWSIIQQKEEKKIGKKKSHQYTHQCLKLTLLVWSIDLLGVVFEPNNLLTAIAMLHHIQSTVMQNNRIDIAIELILLLQKVTLRSQLLTYY